MNKFYTLLFCGLMCAAKAFSAAVKADAKTFVKYMDIDESVDSKEMKEGLEFLTEMWKYNPLAKYEIQEETISEDGNKAKVNMKLYFKDGSTSNSRVPFVKTDKGWKIESLNF